MALATPRGVPAAPRLLARPDTVEILAAPGYSVQARAHDLSSAEGWAIALASAQLSQEGAVEIGLSHSAEAPDDHDDGSWVEVASDTLDSLPATTITQLWLGFFDGPAETTRGACRTLGLEEGSEGLGIRYVLWLRDAIWRRPLVPLLMDMRGSAPDAQGGQHGDDEEPQEPMPVQLGKLPALRQVLKLTGLLSKGARQWDAAPAGGFFEAALGSVPVGRSAVMSAAVRLNSQVE
ncbi:MAG: hypothetical protein SGPRY_005561, partial [Prymnesium sp.]